MPKLAARLKGEHLFHRNCTLPWTRRCEIPPKISGFLNSSAREINPEDSPPEMQDNWRQEKVMYFFCRQQKRLNSSKEGRCFSQGLGMETNTLHPFC
jgi:hypothetical protein